MAQAEAGDIRDANTIGNHLAEVDRLKLKFEDWHSDKEPNGLLRFSQSISSVILSLKHGHEIEAYLDAKTDRKPYHSMMVSSIITDDPDFAPVDEIGDPKSKDPSTVTRTLFPTKTSTPASTVRSIQSLRSAASSTAPMKSAGSYFNLS